MFQSSSFPKAVAFFPGCILFSREDYNFTVVKAKD